LSSSPRRSFYALRARVDASLQNGNRSCSQPAFRESPLKLDICCGAPDYFPAIALRPPIHTTFRAARAPTRFDQSLVCDWGWVCCETHITRLAVLANRISRAIGTPLEWPEAKKVASHVRSWGIEVCTPMISSRSCSNGSGSNYLQYGAMPKAKRETHFCGGTR
jgi:hypothetical protein